MTAAAFAPVGALYPHPSWGLLHFAIAGLPGALHQRREGEATGATVEPVLFDIVRKNMRGDGAAAEPPDHIDGLVGFLAAAHSSLQMPAPAPASAMATAVPIPGSRP